jgi:hypothetical protein
MAATYRAIDNTTAGGTTTITGTYPSGIVSGDRVWAFITIRGSYTITAVPTGWTLHTSIDGGAGGDPTTLIYKKDDAYTSGTTEDWTRSSSSGGHCISMIAVYDTNGITVTASSTNDTGSGTSHGATGVTTATDDLLFAIYGQNHTTGSMTWTYDGGGTEIADLHHGGGTLRLGHAVYHSSPAAGATGTITGTSSATVSGVALLLSLAASVAGASAAAPQYYRQQAKKRNYS